MTLEGRANPAPRTNNRGLQDYGGGVYIRFWRFVGLRAEILDFYSGGPAFDPAPVELDRESRAASRQPAGIGLTNLHPGFRQSRMFLAYPRVFSGL
jgi:hypothetical protein